jgi:hypothetical protein
MEQHSLFSPSKDESYDNTVIPPAKVGISSSVGHIDTPLDRKMQENFTQHFSRRVGGEEEEEGFHGLESKYTVRFLTFDQA